MSELRPFNGGSNSATKFELKTKSGTQQFSGIVVTSKPATGENGTPEWLAEIFACPAEGPQEAFAITRRFASAYLQMSERGVVTILSSCDCGLNALVHIIQPDATLQKTQTVAVTRMVRDELGVYPPVFGKPAIIKVTAWTDIDLLDEAELYDFNSHAREFCKKVEAPEPKDLKKGTPAEYENDEKVVP